MVDVVRNAVVAGTLQSANHVGAHAPETNHCDLHARKVATFARRLRCRPVNDLDRDRAGAAAAQRAVVSVLQHLTDAEVPQPSRLPGWTVGHVATHIARNAEGQKRMLDAANRGEVGHMYPGGSEQRNGDIEAGAHRSAAELAADVADASGQLEATWASMSPEAWDGRGILIGRDVTMSDLPFIRWREVTVHHADLGLGFSCWDWDAEYVRLELVRLTMLWASRQPMGLTELPPEALAATAHRRVAWLLGRAEIDGLPPAGIIN
jgi:maleylpyruvate isomerase